MLDFIERLFGYSPDGGDGSLEVALIVMASMARAALALWLPGYRRG